MVEVSNSGYQLRFTVCLYIVDLTTGESTKTDLRFFDEFSDACVWIRTHGSAYGGGESDAKGNDRYFRIEKRYYIV